MMKKFVNFLKGFDKYGHGVGVNYKGNAKFKTLLGVFITLLNLLIAAEYIFVTLYGTYRNTASTTSS